MTQKWLHSLGKDKEGPHLGPSALATDPEEGSCSIYVSDLQVQCQEEHFCYGPYQNHPPPTHTHVAMLAILTSAFPKLEIRFTMQTREG